MRPEGEAASLTNGWGMSLVGKQRGHVEILLELEPGGWRESSWEDWTGTQGSGTTGGVLGRAVKVLGELGEWNDVLEFCPK